MAFDGYDYDRWEAARLGEKRPFFAQVDTGADTGTITAATFSIYDENGAAVGSENQTADGYDDDANTASPRAWHSPDMTGATFSAGRDYLLRFKIVITGSTDGISRTYRPAILLSVFNRRSWTEISRIVRGRLGKTADDLPDNDYIAEVKHVIRLLEGRYSCIGAGGYSGLTGTDLYNFDEATGLLTAARLRTRQNALGASGELKRLTRGDETKEWQPNKTESPELWCKAAEEALGQIACIAAAITARAASVRLFKVGGPTRSDRAAGRRKSYLGSLADLLADCWDGGDCSED